MPYNQDSDLPANVTDILPPHAQTIYRKAFNNAWAEYREPEDRQDNAGQEEVSHRVAWQAVKTTYGKGADGKWRLKDT